MIPEGWRPTELGALADFTSGGTPSKQNEAFWGGSFPWVSAKDLKKHVIDNAELCLTEEGRKVAKTAPVGSVLVLVRGMTLLKDVPIGYVAEPVAFNQDIKALVAKGRVDPKFLAYLLVSLRRPLMTLVNTANHGTGRLDTNLLKSFPVVLPSFVEQRQIAETLETWDRAIETVEALIAGARAQKQALMQQLLPQGTTPPKKRLPGFSGEWLEVALADVLSIKRAKGKIVPTNEEGDGVPYIGSASFLGEFSNYTTSQDALICVETDILVLWDGEYAGKATTGLAGAVSSTVGRYRLAKDRADPVFIVTLMENASERIRAIREGSGVPHVPGDFEHWFRFSRPPLDEQQAIAEAFTANRTMANQLKTQLAALHQEKASLMQQLLTGKRRVKLDDDEMVA